MGTATRRTYMAAFLIGGVMGLMAEMAAGLILYEGSGLLRATTVVLTTEAAAAAAGLLFAARVPLEEISRHLRRHLHLTLISLGLAGILTSLWGYFGGLSVVPGGQPAALALLAALPLYMTGAVLGLVCRTASRDGGGAAVAEGGLAMLGAGTGFLVYGLFLIPRLAPPVLVLLCMAAVSGAALLHGARALADPAGPGEDGRDAGDDPADMDEAREGAGGDPKDPEEVGAHPDQPPAQEAEPGALATLQDPAGPEPILTTENPGASRDPLTHAILEGPETSASTPAQDLHHPPERAGNPES